MSKSTTAAPPSSSPMTPRAMSVAVPAFTRMDRRSPRRAPTATVTQALASPAPGSGSPPPSSETPEPSPLPAATTSTPSRVAARLVPITRTCSSMRGTTLIGYGSVASRPTTSSGTPPTATTSRSMSPASDSTEAWKEPTAACPASSMARTTATPRATARTVSVVRTFSRSIGRTTKRANRISHALTAVAPRRCNHRSCGRGRRPARRPRRCGWP